jgi:DNA mismatch endonuclease (patch repair protein)
MPFYGNLPMASLMIGRVSRARSRIMAAVKSKNTQPELILRKLLWAMGHRYRLHRKDLPGLPDIVFSRQKVAVFCDGDFWHGRKWRKQKAAGKRFSVRHAYWSAKIEGNMARDKRVSRALRRLGWRVLRYWESDIKKRGAAIAAQISSVLVSTEIV